MLLWLYDVVEKINQLCVSLIKTLDACIFERDEREGKIVPRRAVYFTKMERTTMRVLFKFLHELFTDVGARAWIRPESQLIVVN